MKRRRAFQAITVEDAATGRRLLRLTRPWMGLPVGTETEAMWKGKPNFVSSGEREVLVVSGPHAGRIVRGPA